MPKQLYLLIGLCLLSYSSFSQNKNQELYQLSIAQSPEKIQIDGVLDEAAWQTADKADQFWEKFPDDKKRAAKNRNSIIKKPKR